MLQMIFNAFVICILVGAGMAFLYKMGFLNQDVERKNKGMKLVYKTAAMILVLLGIAFLGGAGLAYLQHIQTQIGILAVTGVVSLVVAIVCMFLYKKEVHYNV